MVRAAPFGKTDRVGTEDRIAQRLAALERAAQRRGFEPLAKTPQRVVCDARSNDYLGLARRAVSRETCSARPGAGAARLVGGTTPEQAALEAVLAGWLGTECALLFSSAFAANLGTLAALAERGDTVLSDALNHASIIDGCRLSRAEVVVYPHCDLDRLDAELERHASGAQCWVVTESYYGMDADSPDLRALRTLCDRHGAALIVDEAHALGVFGALGRGLCAAAGVRPDVTVGGMGKAIGTQGGFVACSRIYAEWLWNRARPFVFSTGSSPLLCEVTRHQVAAVIAGEALRRRLEQLVSRLESTLERGQVGLPSGRHGPIFPILLGSEQAALKAADALRGRGILAQAIRPPTVPNGQSRLRVVLRADMGEAEVDALGEALVAVCGGAVERVRAPASLGESSGTGRACGGSGAPGSASGARAPTAAQAPKTATEVALASKGAASATRFRVAASGPNLASTEGSIAVDARKLGGGEPRPSGADVPPGRASEVAPDGALSGPGEDEGGVSARAARWVVLGTGTGVGKTFVSVGLVSAYAARGVEVAGLKPVETGVGVSGLTSDAARLERASFHVKHPTPHPLYAFRDPVTPSLAARREGKAIELAGVATWLRTLAPVQEAGCRAPATRAAPAEIIETAGGVFSPLGPGQTNFTLAQLLEPAVWLLVAPDRLGVLHELASTLTAMESRGRQPDWIVLSAPQRPDASTGHNAAELREMGIFLPILQLPWGAPGPLSTLLNRSGRSAA